MANDDAKSGDGQQQTLPNVGDEAVKAAEARVKAAEAKAAKLEEEERKRQAAADKAKRDADVKSIDDAKRALEDAEKRAADFESRAKAAEDRIRKRIDSRYERLPAETRERIATFRESLPLEQWEKLVDMELERAPTESSDAGDASVASNGNIVPPVSTAGAGRRVHSRDGRELHPKTVEILEALGQGTDLAKKVLTVQREVEGGITRGRFVYPQGLLKKHLRERALAPVLMTEENRRKIFGV